MEIKAVTRASKCGKKEYHFPELPILFCGKHGQVWRRLTLMFGFNYSTATVLWMTNSARLYKSVSLK